MGKVPPSLRSVISVSKLMRTPASQTQQSPTPIPLKLHQFWKKNPKTKQPIPLSQFRNLPSITLTSPSLSEAKTLFNSLANSSKTTFDGKVCNSVLQSFSAISTLQDSISLLNHMIKTQPTFSPNRSSYHILLCQSCKSLDDSLSSVHQVLNLMSSHGFPPDKISADIAIRTLCSSGREEHAIELIKEFHSKDSTPDSFTYNFLVKHLCKNRTLSSVNSFINDMRENFNMKPDLVTYTILIDNVCNSKNLREATRLLGVLSQEGFKPDCYVYNTIMKGYCMLNLGGEVLGIYKKMQEEGVKPDLVTYNTLVYGLSKTGRVKEANKFLGIMAETGNFPDAVTYTSLMNGMCRDGDALGALALLKEMESKECTPNSCTYNTLLHGLCKSRLLDKATELYEAMKEGSMKLETGSFGTFVRTLCRNGRIAEAYEVFDYALQSKSLADVVAYSTLESTLKWFRKSKEQGLLTRII